MKTEMKNKLYEVTMADSDIQWVQIIDLKTGKELVFVYTSGMIKVRGVEIPEPKICKECGRELP